MTATFIKMSLYFYTGIFLEFCLNFSLVKTVYEDKPYHIVFVSFLSFFNNYWTQQIHIKHLLWVVIIYITDL